MKKHLLLWSAFICLTFAIAGCAGEYYVTSQPGDPAYVRPVAPGSGYVWIDGDWYWSGGAYVYHNGYWAHPRAGYSWHRGYWNHGARGYSWHRGGWAR